MIGNCLFGAIYLHLKDRKNTKLIKIPSCIVHEGIMPHFLCYNINDNTVTHFIRNNQNSRLHFLYRGHFETKPKETFDIVVNKKLEDYLNKKETKLRYSYYDTFATKYRGWRDTDDELPTFEGGLPYTKKAPFVQFTKLGETVEIKTVKFEDDGTIKIPEGYYSWRYINPDTDNVLYSSYIFNNY